MRCRVTELKRRELNAPLLRHREAPFREYVKPRPIGRRLDGLGGKFAVFSRTVASYANWFWILVFTSVLN
jgi:hypothetical protein